MVFEQTAVTLRPGLTLVTGDAGAGRSNGAGKTALVDALCWALYGRTTRDILWGQPRRDIRADDIVRGDGPAEVTVWWDGHKIVRTRKPNGLRWCHGETDLSQMDMAKTQAGIDARLHVSFEAAMQTIVFGQNTQRFSYCTDAQKKQLIEDVLDVRLFERAGERVKEHRRALVEKLESADDKAAALRGKIEELTRQQEESEKSEGMGLVDRAECVRMRSRLAELQAKVDSLHVAERKLGTEVARLDSQRAALHGLNGKGQCPTCLRPITAEAVRAIMGRVTDPWTHWRGVWHRVNGELQAAKADLEKVRARLEEGSALEAKRDWGLSQKAFLEERRQQREREQAVSERLREKYRAAASEYESMGDVFGLYGARLYGLRTAVGLLSDWARAYLSRLSDDIELRLSVAGDRIGMSVDVRNGRNRYSHASGGQRKRVDLALHLALRRLVRPAIPLLVLDEILDELDEAGVEAVLSLLREEAEGIGAILVTSHSDSIKRVPVWNAVLTVKKEAGRSRVEE